MTTEIDSLRKAVEASGIRNVTIVDDAFDPPDVDESCAGALLEMLSDPNFPTSILGDESSSVISAANQDLSTSEFDSESISHIMRRLYGEFIRDKSYKWDPARVFAERKGPNLDFLRPLLALLAKFDCLLVAKLGLTEVTDEPTIMPDLIFVDLYLDPSLSPVGAPGEAAGQDAIVASLIRIKPLLAKNPSIVLMSSHEEQGKSAAERYRHRLEGEVYASRFAFLAKGHVFFGGKPRTPSLNDKASDTLLDIFHTHRFGKALAAVVNGWLNGATRAVKQMQSAVRDLQLKEIAYLVQFRLDAEGQNLHDYLEWFFGEALLNYMAEAASDARPDDSTQDALDPKFVSEISGRFEPTGNLAAMYYRVRVESSKGRARENFRLGDLYHDQSKQRVLAVMTPNCDLMLRGAKGKGARKAGHLLIVPGELKELNTVSAGLSDFLMIDSRPYSVNWQLAKLFSVEFSGNFSGPGKSDGQYRYLGALRPMYAQELQTKLLGNIGRVGVAVPPVIAQRATVEVYVKDKNSKWTNASSGKDWQCTLVWPGTLSAKSRSVFDSDTIDDIYSIIAKLPDEQIHEDGVKARRNLTKNSGTSLKLKLKKGPEIDANVIFNVWLSASETKESAAWCNIRLNVTGHGWS